MLSVDTKRLVLKLKKKRKKHLSHYLYDFRSEFLTPSLLFLSEIDKMVYYFDKFLIMTPMYLPPRPLLPAAAPCFYSTIVINRSENKVVPIIDNEFC